MRKLATRLQDTRALSDCTLGIILGCRLVRGHCCFPPFSQRPCCHSHPATHILSLTSTALVDTGLPPTHSDAAGAGEDALASYSVAVCIEHHCHTIQSSHHHTMASLDRGQTGIGDETLECAFDQYAFDASQCSSTADNELAALDSSCTMSTRLGRRRHVPLSYHTP